MRTHVNFPRVNNIEEMYERRPVNVKVEREREAIYERPRLNVKFGRGSTFTFTRDFLCTASIFFFFAR